MIKTIFYFLITFTCIFGQASAQITSVDDENYDIQYLKFDIDSYILGEVKKGEKVNFEIPFTNVSDTIVYIDFVSSCDCTTIEFPRTGIKPKGNGVLKVTFDSTSKDVSETTDIDVFIKNKDPETGSQIYYTLEYSFELIK